MRCLAFAALLGVALSSSAHATDRDAPPAAGPADVFGGIVQERDVSLIFGYFREALSAAVEGRDVIPPPPEELIQRAEVLGGEMKRRGAAAGRAILDAIEGAVRERLRDFDGQALPNPPGRMRL